MVRFLEPTISRRVSSIAEINWQLLTLPFPQRPIALKGHERAINQILYNREGDLIFTCAKDNKPCVWYADNGERLGTYKGHNGAVWTLDVSSDSRLLITGSADSSTKLWDVETGQDLFTFRNKVSVRSVNFAAGDQMFLSVTDQIMGYLPTILLYRVAGDRSSQREHADPIREITQGNQPYGKINQAMFGPLNTQIYTANEDGTIRIFDTETGKQLQSAAIHTKDINSIAFAHHYGYFVTASADCTAKLIDSKTLQVIKTYESGKPVNAAAISPLMPHVILGGGQDAMAVTTTSTRVGHFQTRFFHKIYQEEIGNVKGHFGPIHTLAFSPSGKSFASGSEDGYVRIHHFDESYFTQSADIAVSNAGPAAPPKKKDA